MKDVNGCTPQIIEKYSIFFSKTIEIFRIFTILIGHFPWALLSTPSAYKKFQLLLIGNYFSCTYNSIKTDYANKEEKKQMKQSKSCIRIFEI
jgi:hypothetical protein